MGAQWQGLKPKKTFVTPVYDDIERDSLYQTVQFFMLQSKTGVLNVITFKYLLRRFTRPTGYARRTMPSPREAAGSDAYHGASG